MAEQEAGRELDALVAEKVMGWKAPSKRGKNREHGTWYAPEGYGASFGAWPRYSSDVDAAWQVVARIQAAQPGWRFGLLGGDVSYAYVDGSPSKGIDRSRTEAFGWHAEFFGHIDPALNYGDRHGEGEADTPALAICLAALACVTASEPK